MHNGLDHFCGHSPQLFACQIQGRVFPTEVVFAYGMFNSSFAHAIHLSAVFKYLDLGRRNVPTFAAPPEIHPSSHRCRWRSRRSSRAQCPFDRCATASTPHRPRGPLIPTPAFQSLVSPHRHPSKPQLSNLHSPISAFIHLFHTINSALSPTIISASISSYATDSKSTSSSSNQMHGQSRCATHK